MQVIQPMKLFHLWNY